MKEQMVYVNQPEFTDSRREGLIYFISFIVWPFGVMIDALRQWRKPWSKNVFWIFCIFFGYSFIIADNDIGSADSARYAQILDEYANSEMTIKTLVRSFYSESTAYVDIAQPLITFLVSRLTNNPNFLFAVFGLVFGYFLSRNIWLLLSNVRGEITFMVFLFLITFFLTNPIWNINGFRMWTAAQIFLYGTLSYLLEGNTKKLIWAGISVLFHFSFFLPLVVLLLSIVLKNRINLYFAFFILTSFIKEIDLQSVQSYLSFLPAVFHSRTSGYTNLDYAESVSIAYQAMNWYIPLATKGLTWTIYLIVTYIFFFGRSLLTENIRMMNLFCFAVLFYSIANILSLVPSGGRFISVASSLIIAFYIIIDSNSPTVKGFNVIGIISIPLILLYCIVGIRSGMDYYGLVTLIGNPIIAIFNHDSVPFIEAIKQFII